LNAGLIEADRLFLTNTLGFFEFNGGLLITRGAVISNNVPFVVGRSGSTPAIWDVRAGLSNTFIASDFIIGSNASFNQLILTNGALLTNFGRAFLGWDLGGSSNSVTLAGAGSRWWLDDGVMVGAFGPANRLVVSNGAALVTGSSSVIGLQPSASNNEAVVTGPGSSWTSGQIFVGWSGHDSRLLVSDGGLVASYAGYLGNGLAVGSNNLAVVTGAGSTWSNAFELRVGNVSAGNRLVVSNSAVVSASTNVHIGFGPTSTNNRLTVDGGTLRVTNGAATGLLDVRRGTNVLNAGLVEVDRLLITNTQGFFEFNGGTLSAKNSTVNNGQVFRVGNGVSPATFILAGNGTHSFPALNVFTNGTLTGNGNVVGNVVVLDGGTLSPGASIGKMVFTNTLLLFGTVLMEISKNGAAVTNDQVQTLNPLSYSGDLIVTNLGPNALTSGDKFKLFAASGYTDSFLSVTLPPLAPGLSWTNKLTVDGSIEVTGLSLPTFASITVSGTNVIISGTNGPPNTPYFVLTATNVALPLSNWLSIATNQFDASGGFSFTNAIVPGIPQRFFQLRSP
ncbi:MAG: hypothetical protein ACREUU_06105, partial [Gammaproteobacteria bacterium]